MLRAMWRELETGLRTSLAGHEGGNSGYRQGLVLLGYRASSRPYQLCRRYRNIPTTLRICRDRTSDQTDCALQCDNSPNGGMDTTATALHIPAHRPRAFFTGPPVRAIQLSRLRTHSFTRYPDTATEFAENWKVAPECNIILNGVENAKVVSSPLGPEVVDPLVATKVWKALPPLSPSWGSFTKSDTSVAAWVVFLMKT